METQKDREKAAEAEKFMHSICNIKFVLTLSGLIDIYDKYRELINVIQKVNSLPHERYDSFIHVCDKMKKMCETISHEKCNMKSCCWPCYHNDLKNLNDKGEYMEVPICDQHAEVSPNVTRSLGRQHTPNANEAARAKVSERIKSLVNRLEVDLRRCVFPDSAKQMIEHTRLLTDSRCLPFRYSLEVPYSY